MADVSYHLVWSKQVAHALRTGEAQLLRDRASGLFLPVARDERKIVALPRLVQSSPEGRAGLLLPGILAGANLIATGFNILQTARR